MTKCWRIAAAAALLFASACGPRPNGTAGSGAAISPGQKVALAVSETPLAAVPAEVEWDDVVVSPDGNRVAFGAQQDGKWVVSVDGTVSRPCDA